MTDEYLNAEVEAEDATGAAVASTLKPFVDVLRDAPGHKRYEMTLEIIERDTTDGEGES